MNEILYRRWNTNNNLNNPKLNGRISYLIAIIGYQKRNILILERVNITMSSVPFTMNERNICYQLVAYPDSSDKDISLKLGLGISTVTKIRNRFLNEGLLRPVNIPSIQRLGAEILSLGYGEWNPNISREKKFEKGEEWLNHVSGSFLSLGDGNQALGLGFHRDFTMVTKSNLMTRRMLCRSPLMTSGDLNSIIMSFNLAKTYRFFNYTPLIAKALDINDPDYREPDFQFSDTEEVNLSRKEKLVLYGLVKYPAHNDKNLRTILGISRQTISSVRKRFRRDGIITKRYIPDIVKIGFDVLVFTHVRLKNDSDPDPDLLMERLKEDDIIFSIYHGTDIITISAFSSFARTKERVTGFLKDTREQSNFATDPIVYLFSARDVLYQLNHSYEVPIASILGIDKEKLGFIEDNKIS